MDKVLLSEAIASMRTELANAMAEGADEDIQFPVGPVQLEFHIGVTRNIEGRAGVNFWVVELGGTGSYVNESIQKVTVTLEPPVNRFGERLLVTRGADEKP
jgi:hypothetical protein